MLVGIDLNQRIEFSLDSDTEPKTVFVLRPLSAMEGLDLGEVKDGDKAKTAGQATIDFIDKCLVEVKNFSPEMEKRKVIESLSVSVLTELIKKVTEINNITAEDKKK